jgi:hypothetical protein
MSKPSFFISFFYSQRKGKKAACVNTFFYYYRKIYALGGYFFLLHLIDWSSPWHPESKIIIDIPTALSFFLDHREHTKKKVAKMAQKLVDAWNEAYAGTKNVIFSLLFFQ